MHTEEARVVVEEEPLELRGGRSKFFNLLAASSRGPSLLSSDESARAILCGMRGALAACYPFFNPLLKVCATENCGLCV